MSPPDLGPLDVSSPNTDGFCEAER